MCDSAQKYLASFGIRPSVQRLAIMEYLMANRTHPSAEQIFTAISPAIPTLSRTTVYNTLSMLADRGAILALDLNPKQLHYDGTVIPHAHFLCTACGRIEDIELNAARFCELTSPKTPEGALTSSIQLIYKGICKVCNTINQNN